ncbi:hypothetical protein D3C72_2529320 [compost metagenome]
MSCHELRVNLLDRNDKEISLIIIEFNLTEVIYFVFYVVILSYIINLFDCFVVIV